MSRPVILIQTPEGRRKVRFGLTSNPFHSPIKGDFDTLEWVEGSYIEVTRNISEVTTINYLAVPMLRRQGYNLDGIRLQYGHLNFHGFPNPEATARTRLGDEYTLEAVDFPFEGDIRRVLPR